MSSSAAFKLITDVNGHTAPDIAWESATEFRFHDVKFTIDMSWNGRSKSNDQRFVLVKNKTYIDTYFEQLNYEFKNIVEIGFFEGGSSVFLDQFYNPNKLIAVDRRKEPILPVEKYIQDYKRENNFRMLYDFDQGDIVKWRQVLDAEFSAPLDLVVDDASHQYELTKNTFSVLFPRLRPGGVYVIEDYGWSHDSRYQSKDHIWYSNKALTNLIFELVMIGASRGDIIESIYINHGMCFLIKGNFKSANPDDLFNIDDYLIMRDRDLVHI